MDINLTFDIRREETMGAKAANIRHDTVTDNGQLVRQILEAVQSVRYGQVQIIIQDSRIVQIDKTEKLRLT